MYSFFILIPCSTFRQQTEQDLKSFSRDLIFNDSDDPQKILEEEAKALEQFNKVCLTSIHLAFFFIFNIYIQNKDSSSPTAFAPGPKTTTSGNGFGGTDFFSQQPSSNGQYTTSNTTVQSQQLLTDDLFSLATPPSQAATNTFFNNQNSFPAFQQQSFHNVLDTSVPRSK